MYFVKNEVNAEWIAALADHVPGLVVLKCPGCEGLRANSAGPLARLMPTLEKLVLDNCLRLGSVALVEALTPAVNLRSLSLASVRGADDAVLRAVASTCRRLELLDCFNCHKITDAAIEGVSHLPLRVLAIGGCVNLTNNALASLERTVTLTTLHCAGLDNFHDANFITSIGGHCPITEIDVRFCYHLKGKANMEKFYQDLREAYAARQAASTAGAAAGAPAETGATDLSTSQQPSESSFLGGEQAEYHIDASLG